MTAPDMFALGGRQDDAELIEAERKLDELARESDALLQFKPPIDWEDNPVEWDNNGYRVGWQELRDQVMDLDQLIHERPAHTLAGAAVKLRRILDPEIGMQACGQMPCQYDSLRDILALIERLGRGAAA